MEQCYLFYTPSKQAQVCLSSWYPISFSTSSKWHTGFSLSPTGLKWRSLSRKAPTPAVHKASLTPLENKILKEHLWLQAHTSLQPALGDLGCLYLKALCSIFCWSVCQPLQGYNSSGIALWERGWQWLYQLRTLNGFTLKAVSLAVLMLVTLVVSSDFSHWIVLWNSLQQAKIGAKNNQKWINILHTRLALILRGKKAGILRRGLVGNRQALVLEELQSSLLNH